MHKKRIPLIGLIFLILSISCKFSQQAYTPTHQPTPTPSFQLQGGTQIILEADLPTTQPVTDSEMNAALTIIKNRIDGLGIQNATVERSGERQIIVSLTGVEDSQPVTSILTQTGLLEFVDMSSISQTEAVAMKDAGAPIVTDLYSTEAISPTQQIWHTVMTGKDLKNADVALQSARYEVSFELSSSGTQIFKDFTSTHIGKVLAIVMDKKIISAPTINDTIPDGKGIISGNFTRDTANQLAIQLRYGALPVPLKVVEVQITPPVPVKTMSPAP